MHTYYKELLTTFESMKEEQNQIIVDLKKPFKNPILKITVKTPSKASLGSIANMTYKVEYLGSEKAFYMIELEERDDEGEILTFLNKTNYLAEFDSENEEQKSIEIKLEGLITKTGIYRIPQLAITEFKGIFELL